ncbi:MAG: oligosaccharide flippase family protein [Firmicutes bacterium]|uniref:Membrane protein involved in the export of O-antigen and teichoic acid n=1 Tax=Melghirimyces thermohalophilus TaxID=1236220 RepID=A0A1G6MDW8_9BACL|nr:oligosaccharide flippase family protein [Melghirimyces thermohalophilus]MDA8353264.1 oligosaccharide flippase family protein [Bacillota bacterium]SDC53689.1 Membrane protein involved in the export of O-antigen and teichoic acid [Melghirimyces thermohalophilus]
MLNKIKQLFSDSTAFALALMGNKIVSFLLVPVYTRQLQASQFGDWDLTNTIAMVLTYFCILGTDTAFAYYFFEAKDERDRNGYFTAAVGIPAVISLFFLLIISFVSAPSAKVLYEDGEAYPHLLTLAILVIVFNVIIQQTLAYARYSRQVWTFNLGSMSFVIGSSLASVYFVVVENLGVKGIFYGQILAQSIVATFLLWYYRHKFTISVKQKHLRDLLSYGLPLLPALLAFWVMNAVSRPMIYHIVSSEAAGIFGLALRFASMIALLTTAFQLAWRPFSVSIKEREDAPRIYSLLGRAFLVVGTFFILFLTFFIEPIIQIVAGKEEYFAAYPYVWMLATGTLLNTMHLIVGVGLLIQKQTKEISKTFLVAALIYFAGNALLIPAFGPWGTAAMNVITYLFAFISIYRKSQKVYRVNFRFRSMLVYLGIYLVTLSVITWGQVQGWQGMWICYLVSLVVMVASVFVTGLFNSESVADLRHRLPNLVGKR